MKYVEIYSASKLKWILLVVPLAFSFFFSQNVSAATYSTVTTNYELYNNLSQSEKKAIINGNPNETVTDDYENYTLVYKPVASDANTSKNITNNYFTKTNVPLVKSVSNSFGESKDLLGRKVKNHSLGEGSLPSTAAESNSEFTLAGVTIFVLSVFAFIFWKRRYVKTLLLLAVVAGGTIISSTIASAATYELPNTKTERISKGSVYTPDTIREGYEYVGYIKTSSNQTTITAKYIDQDGNVIADDVVKTGNVSDDYSTEKKDIPGYTFQEVQGKPVGTFSEVNQTVTYIYTKNKVSVNLVKSGEISTTNVGYEEPYYYIATYYDKDGNVMKTEEIHDNITISNETLGEYSIGDSYKTYAKVVYQGYVEKTKKKAGYLLYELDADNPALTTGVIGTNPINITYTLNNLTEA